MKLNKLIILSLITVLTFSLFAGCRIIGDETYSSSVSDISSTVYDIVDVIEDTSDHAQSEDNATLSENQGSSVTDNTSTTNSESMPNNIVDIGGVTIPTMRIYHQHILSQLQKLLLPK